MIDADHPLNVTCFYWQGTDRPGWTVKQRGFEYINKLYRGVERNLTLPHRFCCFLQQGIPSEGLDEGIEVVHFDSPSWRGCLPKLFAFSPFNRAEEGTRVVVLDLDIVVTGGLDKMFNYDGYFMTRSTFVGPQLSGGDIVFFEAGTLPFWERLVKNTEAVERWTGGRERFVYREHFKYSGMDFVQNLFPNQMLSYKRNVRGNKGRLSKSTCLVSCHGHPRPHEIDEPWVRRHWR